MNLDKISGKTQLRSEFVGKTTVTTASATPPTTFTAGSSSFLPPLPAFCHHCHHCHNHLSSLVLKVKKASFQRDSIIFYKHSHMINPLQMGTVGCEKRDPHR
eukprot:TRINITY_DN6161_c0_g3_i4.p1 TRINITY_DN6161_c0_g3~~TRINITY_DN6161_c0_g3_i4.p1  ORF type:complete len:102 (+),score=21.23 TRINITY_DN6161_c0_g3_i4:128-433(+)